jgi:GNAT superfamily N-acetyltransferase
MTLEIAELKTPEELKESYSVMRELREHIASGAYPKLLEQMHSGGYRWFAVREAGRIVALAGIGFGVNLYYGRYLWVYDLITAESERSRGHGRALLAYLEDLARDERCDTIALLSALHRKDTHRFYEEKAGFDRAGYTFRKALK